MNYLFLHQSFPGQFASLAPALAADSATTVLGLPMVQEQPSVWQGVTVLPYFPDRGSTPHVHPWVCDFETQVIRAEACFQACRRLRDQGVVPDAVIAHPGWGESLFVKEVWPRTRLGIYCEYYYQATGYDIGFDPDVYPAEPAEACRVGLKNLTARLHLDIADAGLSPTAWQAATFPKPFRDSITVVHEGVDTRRVAPNPGVRLTLGGSLVLTRADEVVTFVNRNLEPYRGFHVFMRALPELLRRRPRARVILVGGDDPGYGRPPADGRTWRETLTDEIRTAMPAEAWSRVHFVGRIPYGVFVELLQLSTVHVYMSYPFVLSRSLFEAASAGCAIVAGDTEPVRELLRHDATARLVGFFDREGLVGEICALLDDPAARRRLGQAARARILADYDLATVCLPRQLDWVRRLTA